MDVNDVLLFDLFKQGDPGAFKTLYDRHFPKLFLVIRDLVGQQESAEDIVANTFIKLYERRAKIRELDHVYYFLYAVARNEAISHLRKQKRYQVAPIDEEQLVDSEYHDPRDAEKETDRWMNKIQNVVELLPPARRKIFRLHFFDGLTIQEIANRLNLTETTVRTQRSRALLFLRQAFLL